MVHIYVYMYIRISMYMYIYVPISPQRASSYLHPTLHAFSFSHASGERNARAPLAYRRFFPPRSRPLIVMSRLLPFDECTDFPAPILLHQLSFFNLFSSIFYTFLDSCTSARPEIPRLDRYTFSRTSVCSTNFHSG